MSVTVTVVVSGITDPKWSVRELGLDGCGVPGAAISRILSPFDEAAIECALKLRDADRGTQVGFVVACAGEDIALMRSVASFRPDHLRGLSIPEGLFWDAQALSLVLAPAVGFGEAPADIVLIGREFGDFDDGTLPPCLAEALGYPFASLVHEVHVATDGKLFVRDRGNAQESLRYGKEPVVATVTNAKSNRLRYPLMKNVMAAKRARMELTPCVTGELPRFRMPSSVTARLPKPRNESPCIILKGSQSQQAAQFTDYVRRLLASHD